MMSSDLRIGMVSVDAPPHIGGIGRHVGSLTDGLRARGVSVSVFDRSRRPLHFRLGRNLGFSYGLAKALTSWIQTERIDLLHVHAGPGGVFLPFPPLPMIVTANHTYAQQSRLPWQGWKSVFKSAEWTTYLSALAVACISADTAASIRDDYRIASGRIRTIPCGFSLEPWIAADASVTERRGCMFVGRPDTRKGFDLLLQAWKIVRETDPSAELSVIGTEGTDRDGIRYLGRVDDQELRRCIGQSRLLLMPSRLEGFGLSAAEAITAGTPVVATDVPGLRSVVRDGVTGLLTTLDASAIARATCALLHDQSAYERLRHGCREARGSFALANEVDAYLALYDEVYSRPTCATR